MILDTDVRAEAHVQVTQFDPGAATNRISLSGRLGWSTRYLLAVPRSLKFFSYVGRSAVRPGRVALARRQTGPCLAGSTTATGDWDFRLSIPGDSAGRRSTPGHC
jgi:hypothetical protein